jgi:hypothetical protein
VADKAGKLIIQKNVPRFRMCEEVWLSEDENVNFAKDDIWQMTKTLQRSPHSIATDPVSYNVIIDCSLANLLYPGRLTLLLLRCSSEPYPCSSELGRVGAVLLRRGIKCLNLVKTSTHIFYNDNLSRPTNSLSVELSMTYYRPENYYSD